MEDTRVDPATSTGPLPLYDGWELDEKIRHVERVLAGARSATENAKPTFPGEKPTFPGDESSPPGDGETATSADASESSERVFRVDAGHSDGLPDWHYRVAAEAKVDREPSRKLPAPSFWLAGMIWAVLGVGVMGFACGAMLLTYSSVAGQAHLWSVGIPIALGSLVVLLLSLILQLDRLWHDNHHTAARLRQVHKRLDDLNTTATRLGNSGGPSGESIHAHPPGRAGLQHLLADLKRQLDQLAVKLGQEEE